MIGIADHEYWPMIRAGGPCAVCGQDRVFHEKSRAALDKTREAMQRMDAELTKGLVPSQSIRDQVHHHAIVSIAESLSVIAARPQFIDFSPMQAAKDAYEAYHFGSGPAWENISNDDQERWVRVAFAANGGRPINNGSQQQPKRGTDGDPQGT